MKLFELDDGELFIYAGENASDVRAYHCENGGTEDEDVEWVRELPDDEEVLVFLPDGWTPGSAWKEFPTEPLQDEQGRWFVKAPAGEWADASKLHEIVSSSIY